MPSKSVASPKVKTSPKAKAPRKRKQSEAAQEGPKKRQTKNKNAPTGTSTLVPHVEKTIVDLERSPSVVGPVVSTSAGVVKRSTSTRPSEPRHTKRSATAALDLESAFAPHDSKPSGPAPATPDDASAGVQALPPLEKHLDFLLEYLVCSERTSTLYDRSIKEFAEIIHLPSPSSWKLNQLLHYLRAKGATEQKVQEVSENVRPACNAELARYVGRTLDNRDDLIAVILLIFQNSPMQNDPDLPTLEHDLRTLFSSPPKQKFDQPCSTPTVRIKREPISSFDEDGPFDVNACDATGIGLGIGPSGTSYLAHGSAIVSQPHVAGRGVQHNVQPSGFDVKEDTVDAQSTVLGQSVTPQGNCSKTIHVRNFSVHLSDADLASMFEPYDLLRANVVRARSSGRSKGRGFVDFENSRQAALVLREKGTFILDGQQVVCDFKREKSIPGRAQNDGPTGPGEVLLNDHS